MELNETTLLHSSERGEIILGTAEDKKQYVRKSGSFDTAVMAKLKDCKSPYLAAVVEYSADYMIMEYVSGEPLNAGNLPKDRLYEVFSEICEGIIALHCAGIIHRDIKPSNIMLTDSGKIKIIDYDAARLKKPEADKDTIFVGTEGFAAPEQYGFMQTDERSDIYALGVTMKLLLGEQYMRSPYKSVAEKCMRFDPQKRYPTVAAVKLAISLVNSRWLLIVAALIIAFALSLPFMLRGTEKPRTGQEAAATTAYTTEDSATETVPLITEEISDETTVSTTAITNETTAKETTSKTTAQETTVKETEAADTVATASETTTVMKEEAVAEEKTTLPPVTTEEQTEIEEVSSEDTEAVSEVIAENNDTYQWEILITPEGFPKLADSVSAFYFYSSSVGCEFIWDSLSEDKDNEYFDKVAKWLGEYEYSGKNDAAGYDRRLKSKDYEVLFYRTADDEKGTVGTRIDVNKRPIEKLDINAIPIPRIEKVKGFNDRSIKWEDIDVLYDGFPNLTDYVDDFTVSETDGAVYIGWERMSQTEAAATALILARGMQNLEYFSISANTYGYSIWTICGDEHKIKITWFSDSMLEDNYQYQLKIEE